MRHYQFISRPSRAVIATVLLTASALALSGCETDAVITVSSEGRVPILNTINVTPTPVRDVRVIIPASVEHNSWPNTDGQSSHANHNIALGANPKIAWTVPLHNTLLPTTRRWIPPSPVVDAGLIYAVTSDLKVRALRAKDGKLLWVTAFDRSSERNEYLPVGGGVAVSPIAVVAVIGDGIMGAMNPRNGKLLWTKRLNRAVRAAPTVLGDQVIVHTLDDAVLAMSAITGEIMWETASAATESIVTGHTAPAINGSEVVVRRHNGEILNLDRQSGQLRWASSTSSRVGMPLLSDVVPSLSSPVSTGDAIVADTGDGFLVALDRTNGLQAWSYEVTRPQTPAVAGSTLFVMSDNFRLIAIDGATGNFLWTTDLPKETQSEQSPKPLHWFGPVLAGNRLLITGSDGSIVSISPFDGKPLGRMVMGAGFATRPIIAGRTIYLIDIAESLFALR